MDNNLYHKRTVKRGPAGKTVARLRAIDEILSTLSKGQYISASEIWKRYNERCEGVNESENCVSLRQIQKDIHVLKELFSKANPDKPNAFEDEGYKYRYTDGRSLFSKRLSQDEKILLRCLLPVLGSISHEDTLRQLENLKKESGDIGECVDSVDLGIKAPEGPSFARLFTAINDNRIVGLSYHTFENPNIRKIYIYPRLLKQYNGRWYLLCNDTRDGFALNFRLDQIDEVEDLSDSRQKEIHKEYPLTERSGIRKDLFKYMVGVSFPKEENKQKDEIEEVVFWINDRSYNYFITNPLIEFDWDKVEEDGEYRALYPHLKGGDFMTMYCIVNFEMKQRLMAYMDSLTVISPRWLADEMKTRVTNMLSNYNGTKI